MLGGLGLDLQQALVVADASHSADTGISDPLLACRSTSSDEDGTRTGEDDRRPWHLRRKGNLFTVCLKASEPPTDTPHSQLPCLHPS